MMELLNNAVAFFFLIFSNLLLKMLVECTSKKYIIGQYLATMREIVYFLSCFVIQCVFYGAKTNKQSVRKKSTEIKVYACLRVAIRCGRAWRQRRVIRQTSPVLVICYVVLREFRLRAKLLRTGAIKYENKNCK